jgi:putative membrane protein insertion efficiency factor
MPRRLLAALVLLVVLLGVDVSRPADRQISTTVALAGLVVYQATLARLYAATGVTCRFSPTCSHYAADSLRHHGLLQGGWLVVRRLVRCGPWTPAGTFDPAPVPDQTSGG